MTGKGLVCLSLIGVFLGCFSSKADPDQAVLVQLKKAGSDLSKPHNIEFFVYFPDELRALKAEPKIKELGFQVDVRPAAKGTDWLCFSKKTMVPELAALQRIRRDLASVAQSLGGEYDGWGTPIVK